jgi:hypothetical protein
MLDTDRTEPRNGKAAFGSWLLDQVRRTDLIGELAQCAARDPDFPKNGSADAVSCRLNAVGAGSDMHAALEDAELDWACL